MAVQDARIRSALTKYTIVKMDENQRASLGGLERSRRWRCREGMALKKEQPGIRRVWMILGLSTHILAIPAPILLALGR